MLIQFVRKLMTEDLNRLITAAHPSNTSKHVSDNDTNIWIVFLSTKWSLPRGLGCTQQPEELLVGNPCGIFMSGRVMPQIP